MNIIKKAAICFCVLGILFLSGCFGLFNNPDAPSNYKQIHLDGFNYNKLEPFGEAQPATQYEDEDGVGYRFGGESVQVYLVRYDGKVDYSKSYEAWAYGDPERMFLSFDSIDWVKEGYHEEWTVPYEPAFWEKEYWQGLVPKIAEEPTEKE
ncbi:MAG: hypothetical protein FWC27_15670 [Firmicutes bacterium]|nr:hypothetical protein [Bacillota bacterium]